MCVSQHKCIFECANLQVDTLNYIVIINIECTNALSIYSKQLDPILRLGLSATKVRLWIVRFITVCVVPFAIWAIHVQTLLSSASSQKAKTLLTKIKNNRLIEDQIVDITHPPLGYPLPKFSQSQGAPLVQAQEPQVPPGPQVPPAFAPIHTFVGPKEEF